jgi:chemotaxis protein MotB
MDVDFTPIRPTDAHSSAAATRRPRRSLGWLVALLATAALLALAAWALEAGARARDQLSRARDEAAELRRNLLRSDELALRADAARAVAAAQAAAAEYQMKERAADDGARQKLIAELRGQLEAREGEVSAVGNRISVDLVDEVLFKSGEADISPRGQKVLARLGGVLRSLDDKQILVGGHTDDRPIHTERFPSNWELSAARAVHVVRYLQDVVGVDGHKLAAAGYSEFHPRSRDRASNRRIEILLAPIVETRR